MAGEQVVNTEVEQPGAAVMAGVQMVIAGSEAVVRSLRDDQAGGTLRIEVSKLRVGMLWMGTPVSSIPLCYELQGGKHRKRSHMVRT